jgi:hypothetical protein
MVLENLGVTPSPDLKAAGADPYGLEPSIVCAIFNTLNKG